MEVIKAITYDERQLLLANKDDVGKVYKLLQNNENFILKIEDDDVSALIIAEALLSKINTGDVLLCATEDSE